YTYAADRIEAEAAALSGGEDLRARLAAYKVPRFVAFVPALPQTATQRIEKYRLRGDTALLAAAEDLAPSPQTNRTNAGKETVR
ncbi:MAG: hypothetical protein ACK4ST_16390, partial [Elioraea tepidiphila]